VLTIIKKENLGHYHDNISQKTNSKGFRVTNSALFNKQIAVVGVIETFDINCLYCLFSGSAATAPGSKHYKFRITIFCLLGLFFGSKCCSG